MLSVSMSLEKGFIVGNILKEGSHFFISDSFEMYFEFKTSIPDLEQNEVHIKIKMSNVSEAAIRQYFFPAEFLKMSADKIKDCFPQGDNWRAGRTAIEPRRLLV